MSAHTPGPWFWSRGVDDWELVGAGAERVLFCWNDKTKWKSGLIVGENIKQADARLISASPDMYEALKAVIADYGIRCGPDDALRPIGAQPMSLRLVMAALAKAGGQ